MWDSITPLQLLNTMPKALEEEHLEKLQTLLEADKYKNQLISGFDLCGMYAPFCYGCNKENKFPCAVAYVNYLKEQGYDIGFAADSTDETPIAVDEAAVEEIAEPEADEPVEQEVESADEEQAAPAESVAESEEMPEEKVEKIKIRIAIARKRR